jgi:phage-related baseplate assembly protein
MTISLATLFAKETAASILTTGLEIARVLGLPVTSWRAGDPTRSLYHVVSTILGEVEEVVSKYVASGFLSYASGAWLTLKALDDYGVTRTEATFSTPTVTLTNGGGGYYEVESGDLTLSASATGMTFHNTDSGTLSPGATITLTLVADVEGSDGSVAIDEIDTLVTPMLGVTIDSGTAAVGLDEQSDEDLRTQCRATLGMLSPNGAPEAYEYIARSSAHTGIDTITRAYAYSSSAGIVTLYVATPSGTASAGEVAIVQAAIDQWCVPLGITATVAAAPTVTINIAATLSGSGLPALYQSNIEDLLASMFAGMIGACTLAYSGISAAIHQYLVDNDVANPAVTLTTPAGNTALTAGQIPVLGTCNLTEA